MNLSRFIATATCAASLIAAAMPASAQQTSEKLGRAPVAVLSSQGVLVSWRTLTADAASLTFDVYRNGDKIATGVSGKTNFLDNGGKAGDTYKIVSSDGEESATTAWSSIYTSFDVKRPSAIKSGNTTGRYRPDDMSVGDLDGDGEYELVLKWLPDNARDSGKDGYSSPIILSAYEMDGTPLWSQDINLGLNIRSGNHDMQFIVYDLDGDGRAELVCKTAAGSKDGKGAYVSAAGDETIQATDNSKTYVNSKGRVYDGEEFLTVFEGKTGAALRTVWYSPSRSGIDFPTTATEANSFWGDSSCNRSERYNACVAYLDGTDKLPTAIFERGYYKNCYIWAVDWDGTDLKTRWLHKGVSGSWSVVDANGATTLSGSDTSSYGQGVHGISVGDVNNDGLDEIVTGGATIGPDGALLCSTGKGHGDAIHLADLCPDREGLEVMMPHEEKPYGFDVHDATTGELIVSATGTEDNGRGLAADFIPANRGYEFWSSADGNIYDCATGKVVLEKKPDTNFRIYWTGDPYDQTFDGRYDSSTGKSAPRIRAYNSASGNIATVIEFANYGNPMSCNTTKATPCLQADILGDWREELIMFQYESDYSAATCKILIYSTPEPTEYRVPCLMEDHTYRMGIVWQNSSYNQPPHIGYYLPDYLGIDGSTYVTNVKSHAPAVSEDEDQQTPTESLKAAAEDKAIVTGTCYTAGANGEITNSESNGYIKTRTSCNDEIIFGVNKGYVITGMKLEGYSNNTSTAADRSIDLTGTYIDDSPTPLPDAVMTFNGGTAGQTPTTKEITGFEANEQIRLTFDNGKIVTAEEDAKGKNKQLMLKVTFTYKTASATGIQTISVTDETGARYSLTGQCVGESYRGLCIAGGRLVMTK